jgi:hypothetical protein
MRLNHTERPSAFAAACMPTYGHVMGQPAGFKAPVAWRPSAGPVGLRERFEAQRFEAQRSVKFHPVLVQLQRTNGQMAKAIGKAGSLITSDAASGVPPRGRPV